MWTRHHKKKKFVRLILPAVTASFLVYFGYHSIHGSFGLRAGEEFEMQYRERVQILEDLTQKRQNLEKQVRLLSDGSLDKDIVDEKARAALNVSRQDEIVIFN